MSKGENCSLKIKISIYVLFMISILFITFFTHLQSAASNKELLGRGQLGSLVNENYEFGEWVPMKLSAASEVAEAADLERSHDKREAVEQPIAQERSANVENLYGGYNARERDVKSLAERQRQPRLEDPNTDYFYPSGTAKRDISSQKEPASTSGERPERDSKRRLLFTFLTTWSLFLF